MSQQNYFVRDERGTVNFKNATAEFRLRHVTYRKHVANDASI